MAATALLPLYNWWQLVELNFDSLSIGRLNEPSVRAFMKLAHVGQDNMSQSFRAVYNVISLKGLCNVVSTLTFATDSSYPLRTAFLQLRLCPGKSVLQFCLSCTNPVRHQRRLPVLVAALAWRVRQTCTRRVLYIQAQPVCKNCHTSWYTKVAWRNDAITTRSSTQHAY